MALKEETLLLIISIDFALKSVLYSHPQTLPLVNILVVNDTAPSVVYMDVINNGLEKARVLRQSSQFDVATCGEAADVNLDGELEVAIGTAGQALIVYKWNERADEWLLQFMRRMDDPVHAIRSVDLTGDGLQELVVQTTKVISPGLLCGRTLLSDISHFVRIILHMHSKCLNGGTEFFIPV